MSPRPKKSMQN